MKDVLVSVIIPVYNVERYITRCLQSIIGQTHKAIEVIPVDDGSPDRCGAIIDEFAAKDSRVIPVHKPNGGVASARNAGLDAASGEYVMFVDGDDHVEPDYVEYFLSIITHWGGGTTLLLTQSISASGIISKLLMTMCVLRLLNGSSRGYIPAA